MHAIRRYPLTHFFIRKLLLSFLAFALLVIGLQALYEYQRTKSEIMGALHTLGNTFEVPSVFRLPMGVFHATSFS
jgi:hypothetical protein